MPASDYLALLLLSLALAADAFAVALTQGAAVRTNPVPRALVVGAAFGGAQALFPLLGYALATAFGGVVEAYDHWIAFGLLALIGGKMIYEALTPGGPDDTVPEKPASGARLLMLAVAVSIDAAAAGVTLPALGVPILLSVLAIGVVTFSLSTAGVMIGSAGASKLGPKAELLGGLVLIALGVKVLLDHHAFG